ncbi:MAG TPA: hypothetical protein VGL37_02530 [Solirubrobacteraceae bacterium]
MRVVLATPGELCCVVALVAGVVAVLVVEAAPVDVRLAVEGVVLAAGSLALETVTVFVAPPQPPSTAPVRVSSSAQIVVAIACPLAGLVIVIASHS